MLSLDNYKKKLKFTKKRNRLNIKIGWSIFYIILLFIACLSIIIFIPPTNLIIIIGFIIILSLFIFTVLCKLIGKKIALSFAFFLFFLLILLSSQAFDIITGILAVCLFVGLLILQK